MPSCKVGKGKCMHRLSLMPLKPDSIQAHCRDGGPLDHELKTPMPLAEVNDLRSGRTYRFRVQAFNEVCCQSFPV